MANWDKLDAITRIFNGFLQVFTKSMNVIKPVKNDPYDTERTYEERVYAWQKAFTFPQRLTIRMAGFADHIVQERKRRFKQNMKKKLQKRIEAETIYSNYLMRLKFQ